MSPQHHRYYRTILIKNVSTKKMILSRFKISQIQTQVSKQNYSIEQFIPALSNYHHRTVEQGQAPIPQNNESSKKPRKSKTNSPIAYQEEPSARVFQLIQEQVRSRLLCCEPGRELEILHNTLKPDYQTLWLKCMEVKKDLLLAFQRSYPLVRLEVFGSTVMGIAFKGTSFKYVCIIG